MNAEIITKTARATLDGTLSFPEVVSQLLGAGVEYYHVDYVAMRKIFYSANGDTVVTPINYEGLPPVAADFDIDALRADILDSQRNGQKYRDFIRRAMAAGTQVTLRSFAENESPILAARGISTRNGFPVRRRPRRPASERAALVVKWRANCFP